ncbi:MAG: ABC transporter ATP-binding protein [Clostridia bacterium]|nr:ABC transporter ATP-binding protein [Clostridia bacterium]
MLEIKNFTKKFGDKVAVDDLSISVGDGKICAFIGHNGAGKTTTLKAIAGIIDYDAGDIIVNSVNVKDNPMVVKKELAYLPDNPDMYEHLKGIEYLNFIADVFNMTKDDRKEKIEKYANLFDLYKDLNGYISSYSHGMKQKLALISALMHEPKMLLLDEPFVGLDPISSHKFKEVMKKLKSQGATIFYSTHVLEVAEKICDEVAIIKQGKLIVHDTMDNVKGMKSLESIFLELEDEDNN